MGSMYPTERIHSSVVSRPWDMVVAENECHPPITPGCLSVEVMRHATEKLNYGADWGLKKCCTFPILFPHTLLFAPYLGAGERMYFQMPNNILSDKLQLAGKTDKLQLRWARTVEI